MFHRRDFLASLAAVPAVLGSAGTRYGSAVDLADFAPEPAAPPPWPEDSDPEFWDRIRDQFYFPRSEAFFNTGTLGATPRPVLEHMIEQMRTLAATITRWDYTANTPNWISGYDPALPLRRKLARLLNVDALEVAVIQNATFGMNFMAHGLDLKPGDEIVTTDQEHPGGVCGWQERVKRDGAVWKQIKMPVPANDPDELVRLFAAQITPRTRALAFPHVVSSTAVVMPVKRLTDLAHQHDGWSIVDGAQAVGQVETDVRALGCDAYFSSPHKWLLAPAGCGLLYIRRDRQPQVWTTLASAEWDNQKDGMYRFMQYGTGHPALQSGLDAALDFHFRLGPERVRRRIRALADRLRAGLQQIPGAKINSPTHPELAGATVVYSLEGFTAAQLEEQLWIRRRLRPRALGDPLGLRQSCQIYNSEAEIDATLEVLRDLAREHASKT